MSAEKPIKEWLEELPDGYRERALANMEAGVPIVHKNSLPSAIFSAFNWSKSPEGGEFWHDVWVWSDAPDGPPPPLPADLSQKPSDIAPGHNPDNLTNEQVGVADGWRLLTEEERAALETGPYKDYSEIQCWESSTRAWDDNLGKGYLGNGVRNTYRTKQPPGYFLPKPKDGNDHAGTTTATQDSPTDSQPVKPSAPKDGGPAFPTKRDVHDPRALGWYVEPGMSLRDWFAGQIDAPWNAVVETLRINHPERNGTFTVDEIIRARAKLRYMEADAMLAARAEKGGAS